MPLLLALICVNAVIKGTTLAPDLNLEEKIAPL
jgi:hypothetical protein